MSATKTTKTRMIRPFSECFHRVHEEQWIVASTGDEISVEVNIADRDYFVAVIRRDGKVYATSRLRSMASAYSLADALIHHVAAKKSIESFGHGMTEEK